MQTITQERMRYVALSATIPNIEDIASWLHAESRSFGEDYRPVPLEKVVLSYPARGNSYMFDKMLDYKILPIILQYSDSRPTLVFCATRKGTIQTAQEICRQLDGRQSSHFVKSAEQTRRLQELSRRLNDHTLQFCVTHGVGFHSAGLELNDRKLIEASFLDGDLSVLCTTSTLALGVNLPARTVIIKSTQMYDRGGFREYSEYNISQMIGRAGRPQFDDRGTAVILTQSTTKDLYTSVLFGQRPIESHLKDSIIEHLNAEIVLGTIQNAQIALTWLKSTFFYIRLLRNPSFYQAPTNLPADKLDQFCQDLCQRQIKRLESEGMIQIRPDGYFLATQEGRSLARYYLRFDTVVLFKQITPENGMDGLLGLLAQAREFTDIRLRVSEKKHLNSANKNEKMRYPFKGKIKTLEQKVSVLIQVCSFCMRFTQRHQAAVGGIPFEDWSLRQESQQILLQVTRIMLCLVEWLSERTLYKPLKAALLLKKCIQQKCWENSSGHTAQLSGIGPSFSATLEKAGIKTLDDVAQTDPRRIELLLGRHPPFGNSIVEAAAALPRFLLDIAQSRRANSSGEVVQITIRRKPSPGREEPVAHLSQMLYLLVGEVKEGGRILFKRRLNNSLMGPEYSTTLPLPEQPNELEVVLLNEEYVGLDVSAKFRPSLPPRAPQSSSPLKSGGLPSIPSKNPPPASSQQLLAPRKRIRVLDDDDDDFASAKPNEKHPLAKGSSKKKAPVSPDLAILRQQSRHIPATPVLHPLTTARPNGVCERDIDIIPAPGGD
ncbi:putative ATP-dependent DNA helicase MER3 [Paratrimastix pyriformis]|uniref:DNA 3'-5' helicase n=1 Tax=Paratrimastix pyriformis TaxID=342808 RepID=A0ABQ8UKT5_9EUKA|nr:putative ATP-dependent DNA helicase MER3 [Paratrimastix pyriformis]